MGIRDEYDTFDAQGELVDAVRLFSLESLQGTVEARMLLYMERYGKGCLD